MLKASELKYPTTKVAGLEVYVIPPEEKYNVLKAAYWGEPVPRATDILEDIHTGREFMVKDLLVVKNGNLVELETPFFWEGGGSIIDWVPALPRKKRELRDAKASAYQAGFDDGMQRQREGLRKPFVRPSRDGKFNDSVAREYAAGYAYGCRKRLVNLKRAGIEDSPVAVEDVLAALAGGSYKVSVFDECTFLYLSEDNHLMFIGPDELSDDGAIFSVDVCGQHYESTILTKAWRAAQENTVPIDQRIALALCEVKEYRDLTLESMYEINYPREEIEKQISSYKGELYFDFKAPEGQNIVVRPEPRNGAVFNNWDDLLTRDYIKISLDQAVDYLYANRIYFNLGHYAREKIMTETNPQPMLVPGRNTTQNAVRPVLDDDLPF